MKVTLNKNQIEHIARLIEMKGVKYYDVKMEMTDHMASEVEDEIERTGLEYMKAVKKVFLRYDRHHFVNIEDEKERKVRKQASKLFRKSIIQFYTFPKIIITALTYTVSMLLLKYIGFHLSLLFLLIIPAILGVIIDIKKRKTLGSRYFLQLRALTPRYLALLLIPLNAFNVNNFIISKINDEPILIQSFIITFALIACMVLLEIYNKHIDTLKLQYS